MEIISGLCEAGFKYYPRSRAQYKVTQGFTKFDQLIRDLGAKPIIEGIETQNQLDIAVQAGGTLLQGYFLGKPVTAKELQPSTLFKTLAKSSVRKVA